MISQNPDIDLLVAALATRWGFVKVEQIRSLLESSGAEPRSLSRRLVESKLLSVERAQLIDALADEIVSANGSLESGLQCAAVDQQLSAIFSEFGHTVRGTESVGEEDALSTKAFAGHSAETDSATVSPRSEAPSSQSADGSRFQVQRFLARGGIGQVSVAMDRELNREVAFKEIRADRKPDVASRTRFVVEAEVTGRLEHPGIVPIYSLGVSENGSPFYAMRFIRGQSLHDAINGHYEDQSGRKEVEPNDTGGQLRFRKLLQNFVSICNTLHYAHDRGVVHRDIKPDNIMLGSFGETLVVDWGIAKTGTSQVSETTDQDLEAFDATLVPQLVNRNKTQQGAVMGTPGFMSPEQMLGWQDRIDCRSDIYSLGATLYAIITGKNPFHESDMVSLSIKVMEGTVTPPRQINPDAPPALAAIALKAMSPKPGQRYQSAQALAEDIEAWLADEPISVYRDPLSHRLRRWFRRHPAIASGALASIALTVIGLTIGLAVVGGFNRKLDKANSDLTAANKREVAERTRAEANLDVARQAVEQYLVQVTADPTLASPSMHELRSGLLETAIPFYEKFAQQAPGDGNIVISNADALLKLAEIYYATAKHKLAIENSEQAIQMFQDSETSSNPDPELSLKLADAWHLLAMSESMIGQRGLAIEHTLKAAELFRKELDAGGGYEVQNGMTRKMAIAFGNLAAYYSVEGDTESAGEYALKSNELLKQVEEAPDLEFLIATNLNNLGKIANDRRSWREAWEYFDESVKRQGELVAQYPTSAQYREQLGFALHNVAKTFVGWKNDRDAAANFEAALGQQRWLVQSFPSIPDYSSSLADTLVDYGNFQSRQGDSEKTLAAFLESRQLTEKLVEQYPDVAAFQERYASACNNLGTVYEDEKKWDESLENYQLAEQALRKRLDDSPGNPRNIRELAQIQMNIGLNFQWREKPDESIEWLDKSTATLEAVSDHTEYAFEQMRMNLHWAYAQVYNDTASYADAAGRWELAAKHAPDETMKHILQMKQARSLAMTGDATSLQSVVDQLYAFPDSNAETMYQIALVWAQCAANIDEDSDAFPEVVAECVEALGEAKDLGRFDSKTQREAFRNAEEFNIFAGQVEFESFADQLK